MRVVGSETDLALSGWEGGDDGPVVALGDAEADADVRFAPAGSGRLVAPAGDGLWRRAPWPVRDELFDWEPPAGASVLVAGPPGATRDEIAAQVPGAAVADRLSVDALREAAVVVLLADHDALPEHAMCVLAARRVLVTGPVDVAFGLQNGIEFLRAADADEAVDRVRMALRHPESLASMQTLGRLAARHHAASAVRDRLAVDLTLA
jgi:hypothetical protein